MSRKVLLSACRPVRLFSTVAKPVHETNAVLVECYSGARVLNLNKSSSGNFLTKDLTTTLASRLRSYEDNQGVGLVVFASDSKEVFSNGLESAQTVDNLKSLNAFAKQLSDFGKGTAVVFEGQVVDSGLTAFLGSKYRLGTDSTKFAVKSLQNGKLPLGGALAHRLSASKKEGVAIARFLGATGTEVSAYELHDLGYLTHVVPESPQAIFINALGDTFSGDDSKSYQPRTDSEHIGPLLDTMHYELSQLPGVFTNKIWSRFVSVEPTTVLEQSNDAEVKSISDFKDAIQSCFSAETVDECVKKLEAMSNDQSSSTRDWAKSTVAEVKKVDKELLQTWFKLTRQASKKNFAASLKLEEELLAVV